MWYNLDVDDVKGVDAKMRLTRVSNITDYFELVEMKKFFFKFRPPVTTVKYFTSKFYLNLE